MGLAIRDVREAWARGLCQALAGDVPDDAIEIGSLHTRPLANAQGVLSRYVASDPGAIIGHHVLVLEWRLAGAPRTHELVIKSKAPGANVRRELDRVYRGIDARLAAHAAQVSPSILDACHTRELAIYALPHAGLRAVAPAIYGVWLDPAAEIYAVVMERLDDVRHANTLDDLDVWQADDIARVLFGIAHVHRDFLGMSATAPPPWLVPFAELHNPALRAYGAELLRYNAERSRDLFDAPRVRLLEGILAGAPARHRAIAARPLTLIHGDLSPRNLCLRRDGRPCIYDWELAQVHLPARDVCELLCYVLHPDRGWRDAATTQLLDRYRAPLAITRDELCYDLALAVAELCSFKLLVQGITHQLLRKRAYFERLVTNAFACLETFGRGVIT